MSSMRDDQLLSIMKDCENYMKNQSKLQLSLSIGLFKLLQAKQGTQSCTSVEKCRLEIYPSTTLMNINGETLQFKSDGQVDPILLISALPSPELRSAQKQFNEALLEIISLSSMTKRMLQHCEDIASDHVQ